MLKSQANWKFTYNNNENELVHVNQLEITKTTANILSQRGITSEEQVRSFLNPELANLHDGTLLSDMEVAIERINRAIDLGEHILVFGDYDADGVSSTTVLIEALRELGAICDYYIPNRFTEGYGPNEAAFVEAHNQGFSLIITVDTGIAAVHEAQIAKQLGIDLIITDHHEAQEELPEAYAIIHPKCSEHYPFKELAGVGVAFKLAEQLLGYFPEQLLDLVVIGTIADLVPLEDENRILSYYGLRAISQSNRPGIKALKQLCKIEGDITEQHIGFMIGPRLNAVGRLQDAKPAVELLLSETSEEASQLATFIDELNQQRQKIVADIAKEAEEMLENNNDESNNHVIVVAKEGWNEGVLGIVASKLVRKYDRPAIVLSINKEKEQAKGSARSIPAFDLFSNCMQVKDEFINFGGHAQAAGMTLALENVASLRDRLNELAASELTEEDYKQQIVIDATLSVQEITISLIKEINKLAPFGMGNPKPIFHIQATPAEIRQIGSQLNHLKMSFKEEQTILDCIGFGFGDLFTLLSPHAVIDAVGELELNEWNGKQKPQLMLKDIAVNERQLFDYRGSRHWLKQISASMDEQSLVIGNQKKETIVEQMGEVHYLSFTDFDAAIVKEWNIQSLIIVDLPSRLEELANVLKVVEPVRIYACYGLKEDHFFNAMPSREDFKWFYGLLMKRKQFDMKKETNLLAKHKGWKPEKISFIVKVFFELEFVKISNGNVTLSSNPAKKDLNESGTYRQHTLQTKKEAILYYSTYTELKQWMESQWSQVVSPKEEVVNGL